MTKQEVIDRLQQETKTDPVVGATMHMLALRKRPRHNLTIDGLYYRMKREGFDHAKVKYLRVLALLGELGLARVISDGKGNPQEAKDFRLPLPLIGAAACGSPVSLDKMGKLITKGHTPVVTKTLPMPAMERRTEREPRAPRSYQTPGSRLVLTLLLNDKPVNIPIPKNLTKEELSILITELFEISGGSGGG